MAKRLDYTIHGPQAEEVSPSQLHKTLTIRRDNKGVAPDLRSLYRHSADDPQNDHDEASQPLANGIPATPNLPPTPPAAKGESTDEADETTSEVVTFRSALVTPINQNSPPTPDNTPPRQARQHVFRPFLGPQASFASTRAESFKTAREEIASDDESITYSLPKQQSKSFSPTTSHVHPGVNRHTPIAGRSQLSKSNLEDQTPLAVLNKSQDAKDLSARTHIQSSSIDYGVKHDDLVPPEMEFVNLVNDHNTAQGGGDLEETDKKAIDPRLVAGLGNTSYPEKIVVRRGPSLRDRLKAVRRTSPSASTEKFANIIGWDDGEAKRTANSHTAVRDSASIQQESRRLSALSATSTIGAMVLDVTPLPRRRTTLRKIAKNDSLRSASSPLPIAHQSPNSQSDSPHRLIHKRIRLSNENRWSFGSEISRSHSLSSSVIVSKPEIIKVAVIPERSSSLQSSANSSKRHSLSGTSARTHSKKASDGLPPSAWQHKQTLSESDRGNERQHALLVPPRSSSLYAPTSRSTSRANSITSESIRVQRREAEKDLRKTLDRMESERLSSSLRGSQFGSSPIDTPTKPPLHSQPKSVSQADGSRLKSLTPGTSEWAALRPPSLLETPFSQPSFQSASPEINEATAINYFPHNNQSLQLIEPNTMPESHAVREVRMHGFLKDETSSPLRNPRQPPEPPQFAVIPPTPADEINDQLGAVAAGRSFGSSRRRPSQRRSDSFVKNLTRGLSLKNARNRKADQDLDGSLHPFWRPRPFWDEVENTPRALPTERPESTGIVSNSLGLPQDRTVITGPVSLVRRISERRRQNRALMKKSSQGSFSRLRASRQMYQIPITGMSFRIIGLRALQHRLLYARQRKEEERLERRRAVLRKSIGPNVISQGDSRFPAN